MIGRTGLLTRIGASYTTVSLVCCSEGMGSVNSPFLWMQFVEWFLWRREALLVYYAATLEGIIYAQKIIPAMH